MGPAKARARDRRATSRNLKDRKGRKPIPLIRVLTARAARPARARWSTRAARTGPAKAPAWDRRDRKPIRRAATMGPARGLRATSRNPKGRKGRKPIPQIRVLTARAARPARARWLTRAATMGPAKAPARDRRATSRNLKDRKGRKPIPLIRVLTARAARPARARWSTRAARTGQARAPARDRRDRKPIRRAATMGPARGRRATSRNPKDRKGRKPIPQIRVLTARAARPARARWSTRAA